jgi:ribonuclease-3
MTMANKKEITFELVESFGPDHEKTFVVAVCLDGVKIATAEGIGKKRAEQQSAKIALKRIQDMKNG